MNTDQRTHQLCGQPMTVSAFGRHDPTPLYRSQPIWACTPCNAWEPREGWAGPMPAGWDGEAWLRQEAP